MLHLTAAKSPYKLILFAQLFLCEGGTEADDSISGRTYTFDQKAVHLSCLMANMAESL